MFCAQRSGCSTFWQVARRAPPTEAPVIKLGAIKNGNHDGALFVGAISPSLPATRPELQEKLRRSGASLPRPASQGGRRTRARTDLSVVGGIFQ
jgi:hypothetical protein